MTAKILSLEKQIRQMAPYDQAELFARIDDLYEAEQERALAACRDAASRMGIDPNDDDAIQRLVNKVRYGNAGGRAE